VRYEILPGALAIESRPAPDQPDTHSYIVLARSMAIDEWEEMVVPPFGYQHTPTIAEVRNVPNEHVSVLIEWWALDTALRHCPSLLEPEERAEADRLIAHHAPKFH
jgi:hypothetical protein